MSTNDHPIAVPLAAARDELDSVDPEHPADALPHLRAAQEHLTVALDEAMAATVIDGASIRSAGALAGLSENAVGPRLAQTRMLGAYEDGSGRVTAGGVERARYDIEEGRHRAEPPAPPLAAAPLRFRARRNTRKGDQT